MYTGRNTGWNLRLKLNSEVKPYTGSSRDPM